MARLQTCGCSFSSGGETGLRLVSSRVECDVVALAFNATETLRYKNITDSTHEVVFKWLRPGATVYRLQASIAGRTIKGMLHALVI